MCLLSCSNYYYWYLWCVEAHVLTDELAMWDTSVAGGRTSQSLEGHRHEGTKNTIKLYLPVCLYTISIFLQGREYSFTAALGISCRERARREVYKPVYLSIKWVTESIYGDQHMESVNREEMPISQPATTKWSLLTGFRKQTYPLHHWINEHQQRRHKMLQHNIYKCQTI